MMESNRKVSSLTRSGSSKTQVQNLVDKGKGRPESFRRFQSMDTHHGDSKTGNIMDPHTHKHRSSSSGSSGGNSDENLDDFYLETNLDLEPRTDMKLFPKSTSTTELFNTKNHRNPIFRSTSSIGSSSFSGSETLSHGSTGSASGFYINNNNPFISKLVTVPTASSSSSLSTMTPSGFPVDNFLVVQSPPPPPSTTTTMIPNNGVNLRHGGSSSSLAGGSQQQQQQQQKRRNSSNSRFSEYISSTSSWQWEDEEYPNEMPVLTDTRFVFPERNLISFHHDDYHDHHHRPSQSNSSTTKTTTTTASTSSRNDPVPSTSTSASLAAAGISSASCPSLNTMGAARRSSSEFKNKLKQGFGLGRTEEASSVSTTEIDSKSKGHSSHSEAGASQKAKKVGKRPAGMSTSKSSGCIWAVDSPCETLHLKRPVTLRFTPSGLQESSRVVWCSETGDHSGIVKWVGVIRDNYYAGVEFEKPVGNSSGIYGYGHGLQMRLFTCKLGYGRFVPVTQLILYEDFYESQKTGFICIICRDDFIEPGQTEGFDGAFDQPENFMVSTLCGHLFHQKCLNTWFNEKAASFQHCPYCQNPMERNDTIRIFPAQLK